MKKLHVALFLSAFAMILISGCDLFSPGSPAANIQPTADPDQWRFFRGNTRGTGAKTEVDAAANLGSLQWTLRISPQGTTLNPRVFVSGAALAADGSLYIASSDPGNSSGVELTKAAADGSAIWQWPKDFGGDISGPIPGTSVIADDGTVYVGSMDHYLYAVTPEGRQKWRVDLGAEIWSPPAIGSDGTVYIGTADSPYMFYAVNPDGSVKWTYPMSSYTRASANFAADGTVYLRLYDGFLIALNPDGTEKWTFNDGVGGSGSTPVVASDGTVYFGDFGSTPTLYALSSAGTEKWRATVSGGIGATPVVGPDGTLYVCTYGNKVEAYNPDGSLKWITGDLGQPMQPSPVLGKNGTLYIATRTSLVLALNTTDGSTRWTKTYPAATMLSVAPLTMAPDGTLYLHAGDGLLYALNY